MLNLTKTAWERLERQKLQTGDYGDVLLTIRACGDYYLQFSLCDRCDTWQESWKIPTRDAQTARGVRDAFVKYVLRGDLQRECQLETLRIAMQETVRAHEKEREHVRRARIHTAILAD